jgi:hypothetical protein
MCVDAFEVDDDLKFLSVVLVVFLMLLMQCIAFRC